MIKRAALVVILLGTLILSAGCSSNSLLTNLATDAQYTVDVMTVNALNANDAAINAIYDNPNADYVSQNPRCKAGQACCKQTPQ